MSNDLVTWLRAQLDDDERLAHEAAEQSAPAWRYGEYPAEADTVEVAEHIERHDPARVLAEVDAKRRRLDLIAELAARDPETALRLAKLDALPYAARPGYRDEWKP